MYAVNTHVRHTSQGVCKITEITDRTVNGTTNRYYVLKPVFNDNATLLVPVESPALQAKLKPLLAEAEIAELIRTMPEEEPLWIENVNDRRQRYREILRTADHRELIQMIKTLHRYQQEQQAKGKKLNNEDEAFFKDAEKQLYDEFAYVLHIKQDEVLPLILNTLEDHDG